MRPEWEVNHSSPNWAEVTNAWNYSSPHPPYVPSYRVQQKILPLRLYVWKYTHYNATTAHARQTNLVHIWITYFCKYVLMSLIKITASAHRRSVYENPVSTPAAARSWQDNVGQAHALSLCQEGCNPATWAGVCTFVISSWRETQAVCQVSYYHWELVRFTSFNYCKSYTK